MARTARQLDAPPRGVVRWAMRAESRGRRAEGGERRAESRPQSSAAPRRHVPALRPPLSALRCAFTLIEMLVVIGIMLIIAVMTVTAINVSYSTDRARAGARQIQSYLEGARDRAIYAKENRGVRFLRDPTDPRTVSSMVFIQPTDPWVGNVDVLPLDPNSPSSPYQRVRLRDTNKIPDWVQLNARGLLSAAGFNASGVAQQYARGARIKIPSTNRGSWYVIQAVQVPPNNPFGNFQDLILTTPFRNTPSGSLLNIQSLIELPPSVMPGQEPVTFPKGIVIHLDRSSRNPYVVTRRGEKLPDFWKLSNWNPQTNAPINPSDPNPFIYTNQMDVIFSPRGVVTGPAASTGLIHFYLAEQEDVDFDHADLVNNSTGQPIPDGQMDFIRDPAKPETGDKLIVTLFTRTGNISTHPVDVTDANNDGIADDPLRLAETGEVAGQ